MPTITDPYSTPTTIKAWFSSFIAAIRTHMNPVLGTYKIATSTGQQTIPSVFVQPPIRPSDYDVQGVECIIWHPDIETRAAFGSTQLLLEVTIELRQWNSKKTLLDAKTHLLQLLDRYNVTVSSTPPSFLGGGQVVESVKMRITQYLVGVRYPTTGIPGQSDPDTISYVTQDDGDYYIIQ